MIIADTGFWVALSNPKDQFHALALRKFAELKEPLIFSRSHAPAWECLPRRSSAA